MNNTAEMEECRIRGLKVHNVCMEESLQQIDRLVKAGGSHLVVTLGVEMVMYAETDSSYRDLVNGASLVVPDSVGILWAGRKAGHPLKERVTGVEMISAMACQSERYPWRVFFLGAEPGTAKMAGERLKEKYPGFNWVGEYHGYFKDDEEPISVIREARPDILLIALGFPRQEKWFMENRDRLGDMVAIGVGGSFDVISGNVKRAPEVFRKMGLEWFYRLITDPKRIGRMMALPRFALKVMLEGNRR